VEKLLIFIKHHLGFLWRIIEWGNGLAFSALYKSRMQKVLPGVFAEFGLSPFHFRPLTGEDSKALFDLIHAQQAEDLRYFSPHAFDLDSIRKQFSNPAFLLMGTFSEDQLVGYFFLRFFANRKCFVGRLINQEHRGMGIGSIMNNIMYETAWRMKFSCLSTISKQNKAVIRAHSKNKAMKVLKELDNDYLLVEFVRK